MDEMQSPGRIAERAVGRCYGAFFLSIFGGFWMFSGVLLASGTVRLHGSVLTITGARWLWAALPIALAALAYVAVALRLARRGHAAARGAVPEPERA